MKKTLEVGMDYAVTQEQAILKMRDALRLAEEALQWAKVVIGHPDDAGNKVLNTAIAVIRETLGDNK